MPPISVFKKIGGRLVGSIDNIAAKFAKAKPVSAGTSLLTKAKTTITGAFKGAPLRISGYAIAGATGLGAIGIAGKTLGGAVEAIRKGAGLETETERQEAATEGTQALTEYLLAGGNPADIGSGGILGGNGSGDIDLTTIVIVIVLAVIGFMIAKKQKLI